MSYKQIDPKSIPPISFEGLTVLSVEREGDAVKILWGEASRPQGDARLFVLAHVPGQKYTIPNELMNELKTGDCLWWKDEESFKTDLVNIRAARAIEAANLDAHSI